VLRLFDQATHFPSVTHTTSKHFTIDPSLVRLPFTALTLKAFLFAAPPFAAPPSTALCFRALLYTTSESTVNLEPSSLFAWSPIENSQHTQSLGPPCNMAHPGGVILNDLSTYPAYQPTFNPIDYPCVVIADFDGAGPPGYDSIQVRCGAEGVVRNFTTNRTAVFIFLPRSMDRIVDGNKSTGWVPASHVLIGSVRKYGNYVTTTQVAPRPSGTLGQATLPPGCSRWVMNSAMYLATLLRNKDDLKFVPELFFTDMDTIGIAKTVCDLEAKVGLSNATFMRQLSVPDFTVQSLTEGAHRVQAGTDEVAKNWKGWYLFLYNLAGSLMAAYGGQTGNAKKRFNDHNQKRRKARLPGFVGPYHYSRVKHATGAEMILCAELPLPKERDIFEQLMMHQLGLEADFVQNYKLLTVDEGQDHMTVDVPLGRIAADSLSTSSSATRAMQSKVLLEVSFPPTITEDSID